MARAPITLIIVFVFVIPLNAPVITLSIKASRKSMPSVRISVTSMSWKFDQTITHAVYLI